MVDQLLSLLAPHSCCGCGNLGSLLCHNCKYDIEYEAFERCLVCLTPTASSDLCKLCAKQLSIEAAWCVGTRTGALKALLDRYKFDSAKEAGRIAAELLKARLPPLPGDTVVVPVPTAPAHRRSRGFDHTLDIAKGVSRRRRLPFRSVLARHNSEMQHFKSRADRLNLAGNGLEVRGGVPERILLIDDIYTTGATMSACVKKLRGAGAKHIYVAVIARQTLDATSDL